MIDENDFFADAPITATSVIKARPIISADAVVAVRRGLRIAFSRASTPDMPRKRAGSQPSTRGHRPRDQRAEHGHADEHERRRDADERRAATRHVVRSSTPPKSPSREEDHADREQHATDA